MELDPDAKLAEYAHPERLVTTDRPAARPGAGGAAGGAAGEEPGGVPAR